MDWRVKGIIQKVLSGIPGGVWVNDRLQTTLGDLRDFERNVDRKLAGDWAGMLKYLDQVNARVSGQVLMEIGSGWYPTLPVAFHLAGAKEIYTFDLVRHMDEDKTFRMLRRLETHLGLIAEIGHVPIEEVQSRYVKLLQMREFDRLLEAARIHYRAPGNAATTGLPAGSVDMVFSNSVLEHVPGFVIGELFRENRRILRPGGLAVHCVACNDHYAHFDKTISYVNFLRFSDKQWRLWNNSLNYQNRLRACDFLQLAEHAGLRVVFQARAVRPGTREALASLPIAHEFRHYGEEDLAATTIDLIAIPSEDGSGGRIPD
jgi:SAM-dependent methyltransferase